METLFELFIFLKIKIKASAESPTRFSRGTP